MRKQAAFPGLNPSLKDSRKSFLEVVRLLGAVGDYEGHSATVRYRMAAEITTTIRRQFSHVNREEIIQHLLALWPEFYPKHARFSKRFKTVLIVMIIAAFLKLLMALCHRMPFYKAHQEVYFWVECSLILAIAIPLLFLPRYREAQRQIVRGMSRLLFEYRDVRLLGACIDALEVLSGNEREKISAALRELLPQYPTADVASFTDEQRRALLRELKTLAERQGKIVGWGDADYMVAIVVTLEIDAVRSTVTPTPATEKSFAEVEAVLTHLESETEKALLTADAADRANHLRVQEATENAVLRLRGLRETN